MAHVSRRVVALELAPALAFFLAWAPLPAAPTASAVEEWCSTDPVLVVRTPSGRAEVLHITNYGLGLEHIGEVRRAEISSVTRPAGGPPGQAGNRREEARPAEIVEVEVVVEIPTGADGKPFPTRTVVSTGPFGMGTVLASAAGQSGDAMRMEFRLDVA
jgi:hypothetical protein